MLKIFWKAFSHNFMESKWAKMFNRGLNRNKKKLKEQKGFGNIRIKIDRFLKTFCVRYTVLNCQDVLNLIFLCEFKQSYGYYCSGERCDLWASS